MQGYTFFKLLKLKKYEYFKKRTDQLSLFSNSVEMLAMHLYKSKVNAGKPCECSKVQMFGIRLQCMHRPAVTSQPVRS